MALISSWSTWKHGLLHVPDHKGCSLCLCFLSVLAAEGGCYFLTCEFYKNITRILNLVRRGRAMKSDVVQLFCGAYLEMSHKMLSENGKLYPPTNSSILNSGYYIKSKMNERKVKIFAQESSEMWLQTVMGSSLIYRSNPCPMSSWWMKRHIFSPWGRCPRLLKYPLVGSMPSLHWQKRAQGWLPQTQQWQ